MSLAPGTRIGPKAHTVKTATQAEARAARLASGNPHRQPRDDGEKKQRITPAIAQAFQVLLLAPPPP